jgi:hypothetical protein
MRTISLLIGGAMAVVATGVVAQPMPQSHEQHQATGAHQVTDGKEKCCCEDMMRKMMSDMMQQHQGMGMGASKDGQQPNMDSAH